MYKVNNSYKQSQFWLSNKFNYFFLSLVTYTLGNYWGMLSISSRSKCSCSKNHSLCGRGWLWSSTSRISSWWLWRIWWWWIRWWRIWRWLRWRIWRRIWRRWLWRIWRWRLWWPSWTPSSSSWTFWLKVQVVWFFCNWI